ncbi:MAG: hypothetical protein LIP08_01795 [Bacteroides sp.]|nr:hypothetical protein [Bacteroides sp.]
MKSINKIFAILSVICFSIAFTACTEEAKYTPADDPANAQVYFSNILSQVELESDKTSFEIELRRVDVSEALTVDITSTIESPDIFNFPASVSFADGEDIATFTIGYDPTLLEYDDFKEITLTITNEELTTPYGKAEYEFKAGIPAPWISLGEATFSDTFLFEDKYNVELQQHALDPNRYRLVDPYSEGLEKENFTTRGNQSPYAEFTILPAGSVYQGVTTTVEGLVVYDDICTGFYNTSNDYNEDVYVMHPSRFTNYATENFWVYNIVKQWSEDGKPEVVQLAPYYYMFNIGGWPYYDADDMITIVFPGVVVADYSVSVSYLGRYTDTYEEDYAIANVTLGTDVSYAKVALIEGRNAEIGIEGIENSSVESIEITSSDKVSIACKESGDYTFVAVTYDENGVAKTTASASFKFTSSHDNAETWTSLGTAQYTDAYVGPAYGAPALTYGVEIEVSELSPGKFRLVNPYGEIFPYNDPGDWDDSRNYYIEINATDPEGVYIEMQSTGLNWGEGMFYVYSFAAFNMDNGDSLEKVKADGLCGNFSNGVITFPVESLLFTFEGSTSLYYANNNGEFKIVLPDATTSGATINARSVTTRAISNKTLKKSSVVKIYTLKVSSVATLAN